MADRRKGDRREPEEGVIKFKTKQLTIYVLIAIFLIASVMINIFVIVLLLNKNDNNINDNNINDNTTNISDFTTNESTYEDLYSCNLRITGDKNQIKKGETVTYTIKAENIDAGSGIIMFESLIDYDKDLFECNILEDETIQWSKTSFTDDYLTLNRKDLLPSKEDQVVAKLTVKAKDNVEDGQYNINLIDLKFTMEGDESFIIPNKSINIDVLNNLE